MTAATGRKDRHRPTTPLPPWTRRFPREPPGQQGIPDQALGRSHQARAYNRATTARGPLIVST
ncbi:MAG: hypothetical protein GFGODING_00521 [Flavobacteriales bacterium]|nr:hypothetical protein [Flavobacteriales bacterium]